MKIFYIYIEYKMSIEYTYTFPAVEKNASDDTFATLHWTVTGVKGQYSSRLYGSIPASVDPTIRDYNILTYDTLYGWFQTFGDIATIESKIAADIYSQEHPTINTVAAFRFAPDSNANGLYIQNVSGNVLANAETGTGAVYHVNSIKVGSVTTNSDINNPVTYTISSVGDITFNYNGTWEFAPVFGYTGTVPEIRFNLGRNIDAVIDSSILIISGINRPFNIIKEYTSQGLLNTVINDTVLPSLTEYNVERVVINGSSHNVTTTTVIPITSVGSLSVETNGDWTFTPETGYTGTIPVITFVVGKDSLKDTITLTILEIV